MGRSAYLIESIMDYDHPETSVVWVLAFVAFQHRDILLAWSKPSEFKGPATQGRRWGQLIFKTKPLASTSGRGPFSSPFTIRRDYRGGIVLHRQREIECLIQQQQRALNILPRSIRETHICSSSSSTFELSEAQCKLKHDQIYFCLNKYTCKSVVCWVKESIF